MAKPITTSLVFLSFLFFSSPIMAFASFNVVTLGAIPDGKTDSTKAFVAAWTAACGLASAATVYVPTGRFLVGTSMVLEGPCRSPMVKFTIDGTLVAPSNYNVLGSSGQWIGFNNVDGLSIIGGTIDGQGKALWACKMNGGSCPLGATSLTISHSNNIAINGLTSINSQLFHIAIYDVAGVAIQGVEILAPANSLNTDGIHVQGSTDVTITGSSIRTGDDCVSIGPGSTNLWLERISCGPGHGISIGSLGNGLHEPGVQNVTVKTVVFSGTQNGVRIKTWGRPSDGFVKDVVFQHVIMDNVQNPISIDQNYCPGIEGCPTQNSGIKISDVTYSDVQGSSATQVAVNFDCSPSNPCKSITLQDVQLTYQNRPAQSSCKFVAGCTAGLVTLQPSCLK